MIRWARTLFLVLVAFSIPAFVGAQPGRNVDWMMYNGTYTSERYSSLAQINRQNAGSLHAVCAFQLGQLGAMQAGPVIHNGIMFVTTQTTTFAIDARTCQQKWKSTYKSVGPEQGIANRGVALLGGKLFRGTPDAHLIAIDEKTGTTLWDTKVADSSDGSSIIAAPIAWRDKVYAGLAGSELGVKGKMFALDVNDGHIVWTFDLIPTGSQTGADSWGRADSAVTGGGGTWTSYTLDPTDGSLFIPVGNPGPDFSADYRPGANLFTCSIVVLDANTGQLKWYFQEVPHDFHDWDTAAAPALFTAVTGKSMVAFAGKDGYLVTLDRTSHKVVSKVAVTAISNVSAPLTTEGTHFCPGTLGGVEWNGPAYSRLEKLTYVNAVDKCTTLKLGEARYVRGQAFLGSGNGFGVGDAEARGWLTAVNPITGKIAWRYRADSPMTAAVTPTAVGVVLTGSMSGWFLAFDSATGKVLYRFNTGGSVAGGVATYMIDGKQYVAVDSGNVARTPFPTSGGPIVFVFAL